MIASPRRQSNNPMWGKPRGGFPQGCNPTISILMYEPRTSHQVGTQQSKETARRSSSSFGLYHGQRRSPVETHRKSLLQEEGSRAGRSLTPSRPMTASIPLEFTEKVFCIKSWHNSQGPRTSHQVGTQQSKETARRSSSSFGLYHGQRRSPVETHRNTFARRRLEVIARG